MRHRLQKGTTLTTTIVVCRCLTLVRQYVHLFLSICKQIRMSTSANSHSFREIKPSDDSADENKSFDTHTHIHLQFHRKILRLRDTVFPTISLSVSFTQLTRDSLWGTGGEWISDCASIHTQRIARGTAPFPNRAPVMCISMTSLFEGFPK